MFYDYFFLVNLSVVYKASEFQQFKLSESKSALYVGIPFKDNFWLKLFEAIWLSLVMAELILTLSIYFLKPLVGLYFWALSLAVLVSGLLFKQSMSLFKVKYICFLLPLDKFAEYERHVFLLGVLWVLFIRYFWFLKDFDKKYLIEEFFVQILILMFVAVILFCDEFTVPPHMEEELEQK